jgi:Xaa-Pro aminopeptidase
LRGYSFHVESLVEQLRLVKSPVEIEMIRRAGLLAATYHGISVAKGFAETRTVNGRIRCEVEGWESLTTRVLLATWAAPH